MFNVWRYLALVESGRLRRSRTVHLWRGSLTQYMCLAVERPLRTLEMAWPHPMLALDELLLGEL